MTTPSGGRAQVDTPTYPYDTWYLAARSDEIDPSLVPRRIAGKPVVMTRATDGTVHALADRCAHRPYPLSLGRIIDDHIVCGLDGWVYRLDGQCVHVPTQPQLPIEAQVRSYPMVDDGVFVWIWTGDPRLAELRRPPKLGWLRDAGWTGGGDELTVRANHLLLLEMFADVTAVPFVAPAVSPPVLASGATPPLEIEVSETSVSFIRHYPPGPLPAWHSEAMGVPAGAAYPHREFGTLASPAIWTDDWDVHDENSCYSLRFVQAVTPIDSRTTKLTWRISRNFNTSSASVTDALTERFRDGYYACIAAGCEALQASIEADGPGVEVNVSADAAAQHVRRVMRNLCREETGRAALPRLWDRSAVSD